MSLWGATVITNLLSAIPWLGKSLVESLPILVLYSISLLILIIKYIKKIIWKIFLSQRFNNVIFNYLETIGKISPYALKKGRTLTIDKNKYIDIPYSFLSMLVGLIDGDGHISVTETDKGYIKIYLVISLNIRDLSLLQYINSILKIGYINTYPKLKLKDTCKLVINKTDLQDIFFPLLKHHKLFFLTKERRKQYDKALYIMENDLKYFKDVPETIPFNNPLPLKSKEYLYLKFFNNWIVGFSIAEGSFLLKKNEDACFQIRQRTHVELFEAFKLVFQTSRKIGLDVNNLYSLFSVSSRTDIQKVIEFFSFSGNHPLLGYQLIRYEKWIENLRKSNRYSTLIFPN
jgi:hypothetical protein